MSIPEGFSTDLAATGHVPAGPVPHEGTEHGGRRGFSVAGGLDGDNPLHRCLLRGKVVHGRIAAAPRRRAAVAFVQRRLAQHRVAAKVKSHNRDHDPEIMFNISVNTKPKIICQPDIL